MSAKDVVEKGKDSQLKGSKGGGIFDDLPKSGEKTEGSPAQRADAGNDEDVLTPVQNNKSVNIVHEVKPDETLFSIGKMYGITADDIKKMNPSLSGDKIKPGDKLNIRYIKVR